MNYRTVFNIIGKVLKGEALLMAFPIIVALWFHEPWMPFLETAGIAAALGYILDAACGDETGNIYTIDAFGIVFFSWLFISIIGMLPFLFCEATESVVDAFFETVSGFTTTGATIFEDIDGLSHSLIFWRAFTNWIGGMGILVFVVALFNKMPGRTSNIMRAEMPGLGLDKVVPKARKNAEFLYTSYIILTIAEIFLLIIGGMPVFDSIVHGLGTAGTGGFGVMEDGLASYGAFNQWTVAVFMLLFGLNFNIFYLAIAKRWRDIFYSNELRAYLGIAFVSVIVITLAVGPTSTIFGKDAVFSSWGDALRNSFFQVSAIISSTAYTTADFNAWPHLARSILFVLMLIGGCSGSTAGGFKISRLVILAQNLRNSLHAMLSPRSVSSVHLNGKKIDETAVRKVSVYFFLYIILIVAGFLLVSFESWGMETNFSAVVACMNNIGPGFGLVGPTGNYAMYSDFSKVVLALIMLFGRLEIYPILFVFSRTSKRHRSDRPERTERAIS